MIDNVSQLSVVSFHGKELFLLLFKLNKFILSIEFVCPVSEINVSISQSAMNHTFPPITSNYK